MAALAHGPAHQEDADLTGPEEEDDEAEEQEMRPPAACKQDDEVRDVAIEPRPGNVPPVLSG